MATWIVGIAKVDPKTAQGILRHGKISTTLDLYAQTVKDEMLSVQDKYLKTLNCGLIVGQPMAILPAASV